MECEDTPAAIKCDQCLDSFCDLCFKTQHRKGTKLNKKSKIEFILFKGKRVAHTFRKLKEDSDSQISDINSESITTKTDVVPTKVRYLTISKHKSKKNHFLNFFLKITCISKLSI